GGGGAAAAVEHDHRVVARALQLLGEHQRAVDGFFAAQAAELGVDDFAVQVEDEDIVLLMVGDEVESAVAGLDHLMAILDGVLGLVGLTPKFVDAVTELAVPDGEELRNRLGLLKRRLQRRSEERLERLGMTLESLRRGVLSRSGDRLLREPIMRLDSLRSQLFTSVENQIHQRGQRLRELTRAHAAQHPARQLLLRIDHLARLRQQLDRAARRHTDDSAQRLKRLKGLLRTLGPESAFDRGFSIALNAEGKIIRSTRDIASGDTICTKFKDGTILSTAHQTASVSASSPA
ncbi:MAG: hypothetical protein EAZ84_00340, partial [Verrucomicrobia bacterium]